MKLYLCTIVAKEIVKQLKGAKIILESKIANGTIRESDWKSFFEQQIINTDKQDKIETKTYEPV